MTSICLGEKFSSFENLKDAIEKYQVENNVQLIVKDSKMLGRISKTMPKLMDSVNQDIIYYRISYACEYSGKYESRAKVRSGHVSKRRGCPMRILLRLADDLNHLVVYELLEDHNHPLEARVAIRTPRYQNFRIARVNDSGYTLTKVEEGEEGLMVDMEISEGQQDFNDVDDDAPPGTSSSQNPSSQSQGPHLIGNALKRPLKPNEYKLTNTNPNSFVELKRKRLILQNRKLELESKKLVLESKKLELEVKLLEKKQNEQNNTVVEADIGGNTYYVSHVIDEKDGITEATVPAAPFSSSAAEVIKSLTMRGQPIQIITK